MGSRLLREYEIQIQRLENSVHEFKFPISDDFFTLFENSLLEEGKGEAFLELEKSETMMHLHFNIDVTVGLICDISLEAFEQRISIRKDLVVKFGEEFMEMSDEVVVIDRTDPVFNVSDYIFEYITLEIPIKKLHPSLKDVERPDVAYRDIDDSNTDEKKVDPRWEALKKLKN